MLLHLSYETKKPSDVAGCLTPPSPSIIVPLGQPLEQLRQGLFTQKHGPLFVKGVQIWSDVTIIGSRLDGENLHNEMSDLKLPNLLDKTIAN
jgi:hypothetical protein